jgi:diguanylate cyclase (GGDEF)-like protein/PAS domain S-box-containing protein
MIFITTGDNHENHTDNYIEQKVNIINAEWYLRLYSLRPWYEFTEAWMLIIGNLIISFIVAFIVRSIVKLNILKDKMDDKLKEQHQQLEVEHSKLANQNLRLNLMLDSMHIAMWDMIIVDPAFPIADNNAFWWSPEFRQMLGFSDEIDFPNVLQSWSLRLHPEDKEFTLNAFAAHINDYTGETPYDIEYRLMMKDGSYKHFHAFGAALRNEEGIPLRVAGALEDIHDRKMMAATLGEQYKQNEALAHWYKSILDTVPLPISVTDKEMNWTFVNKAVEELLGLKAEDMIGKPCSNWGAHICDTDNCGISCLKRGMKRTYFSQFHRSYIVDVDTIKDLNDNIAGYIEVVQDITEVESLKEKAEAIYYDSLTGIYNRRYFDEKIERIIQTMSRSGGKLSMMMIDVDFFKNYNDTYGHSIGDACLKIIVDVFSQVVTRTNDFVARYGGEEFVAVLPYTDENGARLLAEKLLSGMHQRNLAHVNSDVASYVTISIGITTGIVNYQQSGDDYVKKADAALYSSKQNGRNRYTFIEMD